MEKYLEAGTIVSTHGVHGEVKILPWADGPEFLTLFDRVFLQGKEYAVENSRVQKTCVLMKLKGIDTMDAAQALRETVVKVDRNDVELEEGTFFIADLIGMEVCEENGELIGELTDVIQTGANDVYAVKTPEGKEYLFPAIKECVKSVDMESRKVTVYIMPGLLD